VLEDEVGVLESRRYASRLKLSALPHHKTLDDVDASSQPELDPRRLSELRSLRFLERRISLLIFGPPGVGKSHIAVGLAMEALRRGYLVRYTTLDDLVRGLREADALGKLSQLQRPQLLILDEAGFLPLDRADANRVFQVVKRRYTRGSAIVTSNKSASEWAELFGDEVLAAAILDRLLHDAEVLTINGPSWRLRGGSRSCARPPPKPRTTPNDPELSVAPTRAKASDRLSAAHLGGHPAKPGPSSPAPRPAGPPQPVAAAPERCTSAHTARPTDIFQCSLTDSFRWRLTGAGVSPALPDSQRLPPIRGKQLGRSRATHSN
jgi:DNA replication protein DnaC